MRNVRTLKYSLFDTEHCQMRGTQLTDIAFGSVNVRDNKELKIVITLVVLSSLPGR